MSRKLLPRRPVDVPFKIYVPSGHSNFILNIPTAFKDYEFYLTYLSILPDFYSDEAIALDIDIDAELNEILSFDIYYRIIFHDVAKFYPTIYTPSSVITTTAALTKGINDFYEVSKPNGVVSLAAFFDWTDVRFEDSEEDITWQYFVETVMARNYYNEPYDSSKHFNALPPSARKVYNANNYLYPTELTADNLENLRFRINIAPISSAQFSTDGHLKDLGFSEEQIGIRNPKKQFVFDNYLRDAFVTLEADNAAVANLSSAASTLKTHAELLNVNFVTSTHTVELTRKNALQNQYFENAIKETLLWFEKSCNFRVGLEYDKVNRIFKFTFPENPNLKNFTIVMDPDLSNRIGFGLITDITERNSKGSPVADKNSEKFAHQKARALGYDTGIICVSTYFVSSNSTCGINTQLIGNLYPCQDGQLLLSQNDVCNYPLKMTIPSFLSQSKEFIPIKLKLSRFLDNQKLVDLVWKVGLWVTGNLKGI